MTTTNLIAGLALQQAAPEAASSSMTTGDFLARLIAAGTVATTIMMVIYALFPLIVMLQLALLIRQSRRTRFEVQRLSSEFSGLERTMYQLQDGLQKR